MATYVICMVKDSDVYPVGTVVRIKRTGQFALIKDRCFLKDGRNFLNYLAEIEEKGGDYAIIPRGRRTGMSAAKQRGWLSKDLPQDHWLSPWT